MRDPQSAGGSALRTTLETVKVALGALKANKMRSILTMLGVVIGVAAVIAMVALGRGAQNSVSERIAALGTTLVTISPGQVFGRGVASEIDRARLQLKDARALEEYGTMIAAVQPEMQRQAQVQLGNANTNTSVIGTSANYLEVRKYEIEAGKMFTEQDDAAGRRVVVLGSTVVTNLNIRNIDAIVGERVRIQGLQFTVVGVLKSKGQGGGFGDPDDQVLIPVTTARYRIVGSDRLRAINILAPTENDISLAMADARTILRREHRLRIGVPDDFRMRSQADFLNTLGESTQAFTFLLAGIAAVSLLVGGIGIMNIMLVSVTERTREIGVRKALGATRRNILLQFMVEAVVLCVLGGIGGILLGAGIAVFAGKMAGWNMAVSPESVVLALGFSAAVGMIFGVWPARRAAALDPIQALRYE